MTLRVPQTVETVPTIMHVGPMTCRYAYARAHDLRVAGDRGQDYIAIDSQPEAISFALCDGVSQSFFGDIAAISLGDALLDWMAAEVRPDLDRSALSASLDRFLRRLCDDVTPRVLSHPLPGRVSPLLAQVLEEKRGRGSESMFICGRVQPASPACPEGHVVVAWMGDSRWRVWNDHMERPAAPPEDFRTERRWSSLRGPLEGPPSVFVSPIHRNGKTWVSRIAAYSDGLARLDDIDPLPGNGGLQAHIDEAGADDMSFVEVWPEAAPHGLEA